MTYKGVLVLRVIYLMLPEEDWRKICIENIEDKHYINFLINYYILFSENWK